MYDDMPEKKTLARARKDKREGKAPSTQAGEFVREEMEHKKEHKHPVKNRKQAIAIGLSKARRAGVKIGGPKKKSATKKKTAAKKKTTTKKKSATKRKSAARKKS
jgi:hypothetical protein